MVSELRRDRQRPAAARPLIVVALLDRRSSALRVIVPAVLDASRAGVDVLAETYGRVQQAERRRLERSFS